MRGDRFDALVVGSGAAGSVAALVLARVGARVALLDKARFPRDKACGDLVGPRGAGPSRSLHRGSGSGTDRRHDRDRVTEYGRGIVHPAVWSPNGRHPLVVEALDLFP